MLLLVREQILAIVQVQLINTILHVKDLSALLESGSTQPIVKVLHTQHLQLVLELIHGTVRVQVMPQLAHALGLYIILDSGNTQVIAVAQLTLRVLHANKTKAIFTRGIDGL